METLWQDLHYGLRMLLKKPSFTLIAVLTLALGIGANTAIFSIVNTVLLKPLPYREPERLARLSEVHRQKGLTDVPVSAANIVDWQKQSKSFEEIAAYYGWSFNLIGGREPEQIEGLKITANLFPLLGLSPIQGRNFLPEENQPGRDQVVLLSYELWQRQFGADPKAIGQIISLDNEPFTIVGVMPPKTRFHGRVDVWMPETALATSAKTDRGARFMRVIARLKANVTLEQARAEMTAIDAHLPKAYADKEGWSISLTSLPDSIVGEIRPALWILLGAVGFVLLIACANVANLMLARAAGRHREFAIRAALGAGRLRLARQLFTESLLLTLAGGAAGLLLAMWCVDFFMKVGPQDIPRLSETSIDLRVVGFSLALAILTACLSGLAPVLRTLKIDLNESLKDSNKGLASSFRHNRARHLIVIAEVSLAFILLIGAGLMIKSFARLMQVDVGFAADNVLTMNIWLPHYKYPQKQQWAAYFDQVLPTIKSIPEVKAVGAVTVAPLSGFYSLDSFNIEGRPAFSASDNAQAYMSVITPDYFRALGIRLQQGRFLTEQDREGAQRVALINETMARRYWPNENPIGQKIKFAHGPQSILEVVGVIGDIKQFGVEKTTLANVYVPNQQMPVSAMSLVIKTAQDPAKLTSIIRERIWTVDKDQPITRVLTMNEIYSQSVSQPRFYMLLLTIFAVIALVLAAVGIYGVMAYSAAQRTPEIGIRLALGAQQRDVLRLVLSQGMILVLIGTAIGLAGAGALTRILSGLLFNVTATDPAIFAVIALLLMSVALLACYIPARRAMKVDPMVALRYE